VLQIFQAELPIDSFWGKFAAHVLLFATPCFVKNLWKKEVETLLLQKGS
jgi:hypothetical protein